MASAPASLIPLILAIAGQFLFGFVLALPGTLFGVPEWTDRLNLGLTLQARVLVLFFAGQLTSTAAAGALVDRFGCERVLAAGAAVVACGFFALTSSGTPPGVYMAALLLAAGGSSMNAATCTLVSVRYGERRGAMLSVMALFGGLGAMAAPILFLGPPSLAGVASRLQALGVLAVLVAAAPLIVTRRPVASAHSAPWEALGYLRDGSLLPLVLLLLLDFGIEAVLAGWTAVYAMTAVPGTSGTQVAAMYWAGLCAGRLAAPWALARLSKLGVVSAAACAVAIAVAGMAAARTQPPLAAFVMLAGFGVGPLAPTIIAIAGDRYPRGTGSVLGLLLSLAQVGGMAFPWIQARVAVDAGLRVSLAVPFAGAAAIASAAAVLGRQRAPRTVIPAGEQVR